MVLNVFVLVAAPVVGAGGAVAMLRAARTHSEWVGLVYGVSAAAGLSAGAVVVMVALVGADPFGAAHLLYLIGTVGVPLAALIVLFKHAVGSRWLRAVLLLAVVPAPIGLYATHIEPFWLRVDHVTVPAKAAGDHVLRIGVLSDLQAESVGEYERRAVAALLEQEPDMVLIPGDLWQMPSDDFPRRVPEFAALLELICDQVEHVYLVEGNTDRVSGLRQITADTHAMVLDDEMVDLVVDGVAVRILGVSFNGSEPAFEAALAEFAQPESSEPMRIVLAHQPDEIYRLPPEISVDLAVAGHTHGGQIALPILGPPVTLSSVPRSVAAGGLHRVNGHLIYVSTGVGRERGYAPQVRFGVRPSIGILELGSGSGE